jgi:hypothetical protein
MSLYSDPIISYIVREDGCRQSIKMYEIESPEHA